MTDATARIKNLSIALEALSNVYRDDRGLTDPYSLRAKVEYCLKHEIDALETEQIQPPPPARPAIPTPNDDIPF